MTDWATDFIHTRFDMHQPLTVETVAGWLREVRAETLEEAATVARGIKDNLEECGEYDTGYDDGRDDAAAAIRAIGKD